MWVPLHVHSQYSILDASISAEEIARLSAHYNIPAVALTDHGNLFGAVEFYKACKGVNVKPLLGCDLYVAGKSRHDRGKDSDKRSNTHLVLIAENNTGYHNLCKLSSLGYLEGFYFVPRVDIELLERHSDGLICLSGTIGTAIGNEILAGNENSIETQIEWHLKFFGNRLYFELQRHPMSEEALEQHGLMRESWLYQQYKEFITKEERLNEALIALGKKYGIPLVATNATHYASAEDWYAHEIQLNVQSGEPCQIWERDSAGNPKHKIPNAKRRTYPSHEYYFKTPEQMIALFKDIPEAISNTLIVAERCHATLDFQTKHYPVYVPPHLSGTNYNEEERVKEVEAFLWKLCREGIPQRYTEERLAKVGEHYPGKAPLTVIEERLAYEMSVIVPKAMCDYLLIVWDFIHWAKKQGIPVGPGRGSGAGSIILYLIGVTDIEPLRFQLFFERFINPERISYPDIDVDICMERRGEVIEYTLHKYGKDNVAQIVTFGTMKAKSSIKDVGRVLSVPLPKVNAIAKLVPDDLNITLEKALEKDPDLRQLCDTDTEAHDILEVARKLEGCVRNTGIHAAGVIISGEPLIEHIPVFYSKDSEDMPVSQYSMKPVEMVGMLKIDFLGLKTLTAIQQCVDAIAKQTQRQINWVDLPLDDLATFALLNQGKTLGVFQLESPGMQDLARQLHLDKFEEIIAVGALYRPGPMDMIPSFIARKHGKESIDYDHPWLKPILSETYGIMVYQEQVMAIACKLANYSLGEGDVLRRAMGKKDAAQMAKERVKFSSGAIQNGIDEATATAIFDKMEKFASYGFNKSHAAAYGYLTYVTAYLKANYPKEWMASLMTCDSADLSKVAKHIRESQSMGISILPPDINEADIAFVAAPQGIRFAMGGIKGIGSGVVDAILNERTKGGPFKDLYQFCKRIETSKVGKKGIEHLIDAGAFDFTGWSRDALRLSLDPIYDHVHREQRDAARGVMTLFSFLGDEDAKRFAVPLQVEQPSTRLQLLLKEKELLGFFLTGHPLDQHREMLQRLSCVPLDRFEEMDHDAVARAAFLVESAEVRFSNKSQKKFALLTISDGLDSYELPIWPELYQEKGSLLKDNQLLYAVLQVDKRDGNTRLSCRWFDELTRLDEVMMAACDSAYDRFKHQQNRHSSYQNRGPRPSTPQPSVSVPTTIPQKMVISIDAGQMRLSHVLALKSLFKKHAGNAPILLEFMVEENCMATLTIDSKWGVSATPTLLQAIQTFGYVRKVTMQQQ